MIGPEHYEEIERLFLSGQSYAQVARQFRVSKNIVAGILYRRGVRRARIKRPTAKPRLISAAEQAEREQDQRDIDILCDLEEGHSAASTAKHWGVRRSWVRALQKAARTA